MSVILCAMNSVRLIAKAALLLSLFASAPALAGDYWVLGSFDDRTMAEAEGTRINVETGIEVLMWKEQANGASRFHLLMRRFKDKEEDASLRRRLELVGTTGIRSLRLESDGAQVRSVFADAGDLARLAALAEQKAASRQAAAGHPSSQASPTRQQRQAEPLLSGGAQLAYFVVGSFLSQASAQAQVEQLAGSLAFDVIIKPTFTKGSTHHRVLVGPVKRSEERSLKMKLASLGVNGFWVLRDLSPYPHAEWRTALAATGAGATQAASPSTARQPRPAAATEQGDPGNFASLPSIPSIPSISATEPATPEVPPIPPRGKSLKAHMAGRAEDSDFNLARLKRPSSK